MMRSKSFIAATALVALALIWGYNWVIMKLALQDASPLDFAALRSLLGALALFAYMFVTGKSWKPSAPGWFALLGLLQTTGFIGLTVLSLQNGAAGKSAVREPLQKFRGSRRWLPGRDCTKRDVANGRTLCKSSDIAGCLGSLVPLGCSQTDQLLCCAPWPRTSSTTCVARLASSTV